MNSLEKGKRRKKYCPPFRTNDKKRSQFLRERLDSSHNFMTQGKKQDKKRGRHKGKEMIEESLRI